MLTIDFLERQISTFPNVTKRALEATATLLNTEEKSFIELCISLLDSTSADEYFFDLTTKISPVDERIYQSIVYDLWSAYIRGCRSSPRARWICDNNIPTLVLHAMLNKNITALKALVSADQFFFSETFKSLLNTLFINEETKIVFIERMDNVLFCFEQLSKKDDLRPYLLSNISLFNLLSTLKDWPAAIVNILNFLTRNAKRNNLLLEHVEGGLTQIEPIPIPLILLIIEYFSKMGAHDALLVLFSFKNQHQKTLLHRFMDNNLDRVIQRIVLGLNWHKNQNQQYLLFKDCFFHTDPKYLLKALSYFQNPDEILLYRPESSQPSLLDKLFLKNRELFILLIKRYLVTGDLAITDINLHQGKTILHYFGSSHFIELKNELKTMQNAYVKKALLTQDDLGKTPIHYLSKSQFNFIRPLLNKYFLTYPERTALMSIQDLSGETPLHRMQALTPDLMKLLHCYCSSSKDLLDALSIPDKKGRTPLHGILKNDFFNLNTFFETVFVSPEEIRTHLSTKDEDGTTPLHNLAMRVFDNRFIIVIKTYYTSIDMATAALSQQDHIGKTPLHYWAVTQPQQFSLALNLYFPKITEHQALLAGSEEGTPLASLLQIKDHAEMTPLDYLQGRQPNETAAGSSHLGIFKRKAECMQDPEVTYKKANTPQS